MLNNFKKPDLNASRYREKRLNFLNKNFFEKFKSKYPKHKNVNNEILKSIVRRYNQNLWEGVIEFRDGVELPLSLGYLFIGTCAPSKSINTNYALSNSYGKTLPNQNWETDGNLGKIFYTNWSTKYRFRNREFWRFKACRKFKRSVAKTYPEKWTQYRVMKNKYRIAHLFNFKPTQKELENYNEFEI